MPEQRGQRSASDPRRVNEAKRLEARRQARKANQLRAVLATTEGRAVFAELLRSAGVYRSIWDNSARIHYNAGRQDWGHELMAMLIETDPNLYDTMESERRAQDRRDTAEEEALHIASADEKETQQ